MEKKINLLSTFLLGGKSYIEHIIFLVYYFFLNSHSFASFVLIFRNYP